MIGNMDHNLQGDIYFYCKIISLKIEIFFFFFLLRQVSKAVFHEDPIGQLLHNGALSLLTAVLEHILQYCGESSIGHYAHCDAHGIQTRIEVDQVVPLGQKPQRGGLVWRSALEEQI
jgi:hypothetical protein